jgi:hypothetical protein
MPPANVHEHMRAANDFIAKEWCPHSLLGADNAQSLGYAAVVANLHELPCTVAYMMAGLHAMDGVLLKIRQKAIPASVGMVFYHYAKTNKSGMQSLVDEAPGVVRNVVTDFTWCHQRDSAVSISVVFACCTMPLHWCAG